VELDLTGFEFLIFSTQAAESARLVLRKNWRLKAVLMALASRVPGGVLAYRFVQDRQAQRLNDADGLLARSLDLLALYDDGGGEIRGKDCLEIGTGWCPWLPLLLKVKGARRVVTLDLNPWLSIRTAYGTTRALAERIDRVAERLEVPRGDIEKVLDPALRAKNLQEWLAAVDVEYLPKTELQRAAFAAESFDAVFSSNVLEHVDANCLGALHRESARILRSGGIVAHRFNPQDHFSFGDPTITGANFLKYSPAAWKWIGGSGLAYHNRLRCRQHRQLIDDAGFSVELQRTRPDRKAQQAIDAGRLLVHADFSGMSSAELTDDYMWVVARKP
jgi:SAM-dependent methyltransferase